jgi:hypothetical protein
VVADLVPGYRRALLLVDIEQQHIHALLGAGGGVAADQRRLADAALAVCKGSRYEGRLSLRESNILELHDLENTLCGC